MCDWWPRERERKYLVLQFKPINEQKKLVTAAVNNMNYTAIMVQVFCNLPAEDHYALCMLLSRRGLNVISGLGV